MLSKEWIERLEETIFQYSYGPHQVNLVLIACASSEGSGEPAHPRTLARTFAAHSYKQWIKRNLPTESQIPCPAEWLGMRRWNFSWRNARRQIFAWRRSYTMMILNFGTTKSLFYWSTILYLNAFCKHSKWTTTRQNLCYMLTIKTQISLHNRRV